MINNLKLIHFTIFQTQICLWTSSSDVILKTIPAHMTVYFL